MTSHHQRAVDAARAILLFRLQHAYPNRSNFTVSRTEINAIAPIIVRHFPEPTCCCGEIRKSVETVEPYQSILHKAWCQSLKMSTSSTVVKNNPCNCGFTKIYDKYKSAINTPCLSPSSDAPRPRPPEGGKCRCGELLEAAKMGLIEMKRWRDNDECDCPAEGHICGMPRLSRSIKLVESAIAEWERK